MENLGSGKSTYCFSQIADLLSEKEKIFIITPEQFSFTAETKLMEAIPQRSVLNAEVITLSRMAYRVMEEVGGNQKTTLSKCGKSMLIYSILSSYKKQLKFLGKSDENIEVAMTAITEFKKHGITVPMLLDEMEKIEDTYLKNKLFDMLLVYENFENKIKGDYLDETDLLTLLAQKLPHTNLVKTSIIFIDEFAGFTKQEYEVIRVLIQQAKQVNITLCVDNLEVTTNPDTDIFYANKVTLQKLLHLAKKHNLTLDEPLFLPKQHRFKTEELAHINHNLYQIKPTKYLKEPEHLHLFIAKNQYSEIEKVAKEIVTLITQKNLRYQDIAIITKNLASYATLVRAIFPKYHIPVFIDEKRELNQNIVIQYLLSIFEIFRKNFATETVLHYMKLGFHTIDKEEIYKLENYCSRWGINHNKWKKDFVYGIDTKEEKSQVERLNEIRRQVINPLLNLKEKIGKQKTAIHITKCLYEFLQTQQIEEKISQDIHQLESIGLHDLANEYIASYQILLSILDEIVLVFESDSITFDQYQSILKTGLKNSGLSKIPGTQDQVILGDVDRSRSHKVNTVFIIGLNDGVFPSIHKDEGFFNDDDRALLKQDGLELANGTLENLYEDNFNIYKAFTTAENNMYLSYSSSDSEGNSLRPSYFIHKIKKLFPSLIEESDVITKSYEVVSPLASYEQMLENIANVKKEGRISPIWYEVYQYFKNQPSFQDRLQKDLQGLDYTNIPTPIAQEKIDKLYGNTLKASVSKLERYRSCPFSYYLQYGLHLKEKPTLQVQSFDTGSFMHETIDLFFEQVKQENLKLVDLEEEQIRKMVSCIIDENLHLSKNFIFTATPKYIVLVKRLKKIVTKALQYLILTLTNSQFNIEGTEIEFGKGQTYPPISLSLDSGKQIEITGKIDRIDTALSENGNYLRIIDYKSSVKDIDFNEVYAGLQIQLLTYMDAICKEENYLPAGAFYFPLLEQMIKAEKRCSPEEIEEQIRKNFKMKGLILADVTVIQMHDTTLKTGSSKMVPAAITQSGTINEKWTKGGVNLEEFAILQNHIDVTIKQIAKEILSGNIAIKPYYKNGKTACEYCSYKAICGFNPKQSGNSYYYIDHKSKDEILQKMKQEKQIQTKEK